MAKKTVTMYMHLIEGKPAWWSEHDGQIVYADTAKWKRDRPLANAVLRKNLRQIRRDQQKTIRNRAKWNISDSAGKYGYVRVEVPE